MTTNTPAYWVIIPAAGCGQRFQENAPKQYLQVDNKTLLEYAVEPFIEHSAISKVVIALSPSDIYFPHLSIAYHPKIATVKGGATRMESVQNALAWIESVGHPQDWVLVHDAARPALHGKDLDNLINVLSQEENGGILASPVSDTLKFVCPDSTISHTVSRERLWRALTPQMFRLTLLKEAYKRCAQIELTATDEAHAVEQCGVKPKVVKANYPNPKLTYLSDFDSLAYLLTSTKQELEQCE